MEYHFWTFINFFLACTYMVIAAPSSSIPRTRDVTVGGVSFVGTIHGVPVSYNGTVESMYAQFSAEHPDVVAAYNANNPAVGTIEHYYANLNQRALPRDSNGLSKRENKLNMACCPVAGWGWAGALNTTIGGGISYINTHKGLFTLAPYTNSRISCSYNNAIFWDNNSPSTQIELYSYIASFAQDTLDSPLCTTYNPVTNAYYTCGQEFDSAGYNIVVRQLTDDHC